MFHAVENSLRTSSWLLSLCLLITACGDSSLPPRSVLDFEEDPSATDAKLLTCRQTPGLARTDPECANARAAANRLAAADDRIQREQLDHAAIRELEGLRAERDRLDARIASRQAALRALAEEKVASGLTLTDAEARALGLDPRDSLLVGGNDPRPGSATPAPQSAPQYAPARNMPVQPRPAPQPARNTTTKSLSEIREALNASGEPPANGANDPVDE